MKRTRVTPRHQTTMPRDVHRRLGIKAVDEVEGQRVRDLVVVRSRPHLKNPVKFLTSQVRLDIDAVKIVSRAREELF